MKTILVTGASGFVGSRFVARWRNEYNILAPTHAELDITDYASVSSYFVLRSPDVVVHLAALSNTGYCEQNPDDSYRVNVEGACNIARASAMCGAKMIFFSSDQVYNGNLESGLLSEDLPVSPENVYGKHKLEAEERVLAFCPGAVVLRATWMYDKEREGMFTHANFVTNISKAVKERTPLVFPVREYRGITWIREVVEFLPQTFKLPMGTYNYGAENDMNTYETACCFCEMLAGLHAGPILNPNYDRYPEHERNISISTDKIFRVSGGTICFSNTMSGLRLFVEIGDEC
ncbi:MAG: NAD(P)-dependent oxidoreductase [Bacteroidaceae bacterium]|nr:NAD(P)-dependent oxidoreductase [Bacteroidaceae bacterium]